MTKLCVAHRSVLCGLVLALTAVAQCPPPGGYPPPLPPPPTIGGTWTPSNPASPTTPRPAGPSAPRPAGPAAPAPEQPGKDGPITPRRPAAGLRPGPRTGGIAIDFERGATSKDRLKVDWVHPVPPQRSSGETAAAGALPLEEAVALLWDTGDTRPLLVLRECSLCKDGDEALMSRSLSNDRTLLLTKWFRTVRLPSHVTEQSHPFFNVFASLYSTKDGWPHFFLLAHPGAQPVTFTGQQTQTQLWKGMQDVLSQRYAKDPAKAIKEWLSVLDGFDQVDARRRQLQEELDATRANEGPESQKAKRLTESLAKLQVEREELLAREAKAKDLGLLPPPRTVGALTK